MLNSVFRLQRLSSDVMKNAEALRIWGSGEGDDLGDILGASATLLTQWSSALSRFSAHEQPMREHLKVIRTREENLDELKRRRKSVGAKAEAAERKLNKMGAEHKNATAQTDSLNALRAEIRSMDSEIMTEEAALGDFKRTMTRVWMGLKFGALLECSEKGTIAAEYGKLIIGEIVEEQTQPGMARSLYYGRQKTENLLSEAYRCINDVVLSTVLPNPSPQHFFPEPEQKQFAPPNLPTGYGMQGATQLPVQPTQSAFQIPELTSHNEWQPQSQPQSPFLPRAEQSHNPGDQHPNLPVPQGSGTGQFSEQPDSPAHFDLSHQHQRYPSQPAQPHSPPYTVEEPAAPPRSVDDFGINTNSFGQMDMGSPGQGASARFATFPVKHRSYQLADPQAPPGQESESFSIPQQGDRSSTTDGRFQHQRRVPPPVFDPAEEERSLNAAAAREVSREMDALTFNPPIPQQDREHTHSVSSPNPGYGAQPNVPPGEQDREHSVASTHPGYEAQHNVPPGEQLAPPSAPYSGAPSSNTDSPVLPYPSYKAQPSVTPGEQLASPSTPYSGAPSSNTDSPVLPYTSYKAQPNVPPGEQLAPPSAPYSGAPSPNTDSPVLPYPSYNAPLTMNNSSPYPPGPIQQQPSRPSVDSQAAAPRHSNDGPPRLPPLATQLPSGPYSNPNTAPGEYPRSLGAFPGPAPKSTSSLTASGPPGARTISASAFKRPQRVPSNEPPSTFSEVSPLSIKKRIPSSPYPNIREGSPSRPSRSGSGSPARPPAPPPSQALPPVPKDDGNYDYASAYADSGAPQEATAQRERKQSGYGDGRFSTDLERPLR
ncbi:hypothetical protein C0993_011711 [Termitomyces sp. T159_Od127]|nr:hypothetical protein C0993_011711 [Termitomyces sp. T159_Od127]